MKTTSFATPWGPGWLFWEPGGIRQLLLPGALLPFEALFSEPEPFGAVGQLADYFAGRLKQFRLPLLLSGTPFQLRVWEKLQQIPYGQCRSYQQVAQLIGAQQAARAVGNACHANPLPLLIPCHRVIRSDGRWGGFGGGPALKAALLELEMEVGNGKWDKKFKVPGLKQQI